MREAFEFLELCRIAKHDVGQAPAIDHLIDNDRRPRLGDSLESLAARFEHLVADLIRIDHQRSSSAQQLTD
jgi:hypothetical protein